MHRRLEPQLPPDRPVCLAATTSVGVARTTHSRPVQLPPRRCLGPDHPGRTPPAPRPLRHQERPRSRRCTTCPRPANPPRAPDRGWPPGRCGTAEEDDTRDSDVASKRVGRMLMAAEPTRHHRQHPESPLDRPQSRSPGPRPPRLRTRANRRPAAVRQVHAQHPHLGELLLSTGDATILYTEADSFF